MNTEQRPTFLVNNKVYVSAGVLIYTNDEMENYYFLFQRLTNDKRMWTYEDFGGKSQNGDNSIEDVAFRECYEETNKLVFTPEFLKKQLKDRRSVIYQIPECKYMLYIIYVPYDFKENLDLDQFGIKNNDDQPRILEWLSYKSLMELDTTDLQPRFMPTDFKINLPIILARPRMLPDDQYM